MVKNILKDLDIADKGSELNGEIDLVNLKFNGKTFEEIYNSVNTSCDFISKEEMDEILEPISFKELGKDGQIDFIKNYLKSKLDDIEYKNFLKNFLGIDVLSEKRKEISKNIFNKFDLILKNLTNEKLEKLVSFFNSSFEDDLLTGNENYVNRNIQEIIEKFYNGSDIVFITEKFSAGNNDGYFGGGNMGSSWYEQKGIKLGGDSIEDFIQKNPKYSDSYVVLPDFKLKKISRKITVNLDEV